MPLLLTKVFVTSRPEIILWWLHMYLNLLSLFNVPNFSTLRRVLKVYLHTFLHTMIFQAEQNIGLCLRFRCVLLSGTGVAARLLLIRAVPRR